MLYITIKLRLSDRHLLLSCFNYVDRQNCDNLALDLFEGSTDHAPSNGASNVLGFKIK